MNCMKCGKKIMDGSVFCDSCLENMSAYPVTPGTPVQLPNRKSLSAEKTVLSRKKTSSPEEQLTHLRIMVRWLGLATATLTLLLTLACAALFHTIDAQDLENAIGQNYNTVESTTQP